METTHPILIQIEHALGFARSSTLANKRLAVILFDNLIELWLVNQQERAFENDNLWHSIGQGKWPMAKRRETTRYFNEILKFSSNELGILSQKEKRQLMFCHSMRNILYHKGRVESKLIEATIGIYYPIIKEKLLQREPFLMPDVFLMEDYHSVMIEKKRFHEPKSDSWKISVNKVLETGAVDTNVPLLFRDYLLDKIEVIEYFLEVLKQDSPDFKGYDQILMLAAFDRKIKSNLEEISDRKTRDAISNALFPVFKSKWKSHPINKLSHYKERSESLVKLDNGDALERFLLIDKVIDELFLDANFATQAQANWIDIQLHNY